MKIFTWSLVILMTVIFFSNQYLNAHVGTNATIYDGQAGPYPFQIIIRSPDVIPGWTDITVQIKNPEDVDRVTIQIARFNTEKKRCSCCRGYGKSCRNRLFSEIYLSNGERCLRSLCDR